VSELSRLGLKDLDRERGTVRVLDGKGGVSRTVCIDPMAWQILEGWLNARRKWIEHREWQGRRTPLFYSNCGRVWLSREIRRTMKRIAKRAGLERRMSCHIWRHTMAYEMCKEGISVELIRRQLGHKSLSTTQVYLQGLCPVDMHEAVSNRPWPPEFAYFAQTLPTMENSVFPEMASGI
jgi:integrase/recombinase XerD